MQILRQENTELHQEKAVLYEKLENQKFDVLGISRELVSTIPSNLRNTVLDTIGCMSNFEFVEDHLECTHCRDYWRNALLKKQPGYCVSVNTSSLFT